MPRHRPLLDETRRILALAWPVMLTSLNWTILSVTDIVVVGLTGTDQVAALGASRALTFVTIVGGLDGSERVVQSAGGFLAPGQTVKPITKKAS